MLLSNLARVLDSYAPPQTQCYSDEMTVEKLEMYRMGLLRPVDQLDPYGSTYIEQFKRGNDFIAESNRLEVKYCGATTRIKHLIKF